MKRKSQIGTFIGRRWWRHPQLLKLPYDIYREIRAFIHRGRYGYAPCDLWNFDSYLDDIIANGLRDFNKQNHSYPMGDTSEEWGSFLMDVARAIEYSQWAEREKPEEEDAAYDKKIASLHKLVDRWGSLWD